jgi:glycine/D-amino acid oxidase-like deaminating enzyme/nitrite reductase/ring-hydroxylating ferredoxin subunit
MSTQHIRAPNPGTGSTSLWMATTTVPRFAPLPRNTEAEVCVIGAGIAGLTTAYLLQREGRHVTVIDAAGIGAGETGRTTAHFFPPDERYAEIERRFGFDAASIVADSYRRSTDRVETLVAEAGIDCDFERLDGYLISAGVTGNDVIAREFAATRRLGLDVQRLARVPGLSFDTGPCLCFADQAQFHPLKYLTGLAQAIVRAGGTIHGATAALGLRADEDRQIVITERGTIDAGAVVVATNTPFNDRVVMHTKQAGYRSYVIGVRVPRHSVPSILLWDTGEPYFYARLAACDDADDVLVVGGRDHKVGQDVRPQHRYEEIEAWVRLRFPMAGALLYRWSGEVMEPADGLAYLGRNPLDADNVYVITGDSGNGMTHCTAGAMLVTDLIVGRDNLWARLYSPSRKAVHAIPAYVSEQANALAQYADWLKGGEVESVGEIAPGEGALMRDDGKLLAVYREAGGALQVLSAACPHLGCAVHWNSAEKSWDCPCHASRFDHHGALLHGPATSPLAEATLSDGAVTPLRPTPGRGVDPNL